MFRSKQQKHRPDSDPENGPEQAGEQGGQQGHNADPDETAALIERLEAERDDAVQKWKRALADYQNYQRRALLSEQEARRQGATDILQRIIPILDHFDNALAQDHSKASAEQVAAGLRAIRDEFYRALSAHGVTVIDPEPNAEFNPSMHEAMTNQPAEGVEPGNVAATFQVGYALGDRVIRPAKVAVASKE